ncbi:MAG: DUF4397 domain-containing protein [Lewinella sp.]|nr:DUF4397 domain-containing protein [Lewinella sp.]
MNQTSVFRSFALGLGASALLLCIDGGLLAKEEAARFLTVVEPTLQFVNLLSPSVANGIDLYLDGQLVVAGLAPEAATPQLVWAAETDLTIGLAAVGSTSIVDTLLSYSLSMAAGQHYLLVLYQAPGSEFIQIYQQESSPTLMTNTQSEVVLGHFAAGAPPLTAVLRGGAMLFNDLAFTGFSSQILLSAEEYFLDFKSIVDGVEQFLGTFRVSLQVHPAGLLQLLALQSEFGPSPLRFLAVQMMASSFRSISRL